MTGEMAADDAALLEDLLACEHGVWQALVQGDAAADAAALDAAFLGVYPSGFSGRADHAGQLADGPTVADYAILEPRVMRFGAEHALLAYKARYRRPGRAEAEVMYVSSVWRRRAGGWINVFSQDTPAG